MQGTIAGRYALRSRLGVGGMGEVYAAEDLRLRREVAVKLVPAAGISAVAQARFVREAQAAARIHHPNAVAVFDAGEADGFLYLVMERVTGQTLDVLVAERAPLPIAEAVSIAVAVLQGLSAAHAAGVVHRDVKPANIVVGPGGVKLLDFGIATLLGDSGASVTAAGEFVGTPKYLAPEQVTGRAATPATDIYGVGVVLFEMLTGRPPFDRGDPMATAIAHRDESPPDVRTIRPDVPPRLAAVVGTALSKEPSNRYRSVAEMRRALSPVQDPDYAGDTAVLAAPATPPAPLVPSDRLRSRRRWWWVGVALLLAGGTAATVALLDDGDPGTSGSSAPATVTTVAPNTTASTLPPTTAAPTTVSTTVAQPSPSSVDALVVVFSADPVRYGPRSGEVIDALGGITNRGRRSREAASTLLGNAAAWVDDGGLTAEAYALLEPVLSPIADQGPNGDDEDGDD